MGQLDQFAKDTFALEAASVTHGGVSWQLPPELGMSEVRLDGLLRVHDPSLLTTLAPPWSLVEQADEVALEVKMQGDHSDLLSFDRASLRRLARQVQRREDPGDRFEGESSLWYVASHVSAIIKKRRPVTLVAPGCYRIGPDWLSTFWIAANELPLMDELVPFLVARTGQSLDAFVRWVKTRRPLPWLLRVLESLPMSAATYEDLSNFTIVKTDDPEVRARRHLILNRFLEVLPEAREELIEEGRAEGRAEGRVEEARKSLRGVLDARGFVLAADDQARIDACDVTDTLERWLKQSVVASSVAEALR
jgi:hypothetical protein